MNIWHPSSCTAFSPCIVDYGLKGSARPICEACGERGPASTLKCKPCDLPGLWEHRFPATTPEYRSIRLLRIGRKVHEDIIHGDFEVVNLRSPDNKVPIPKFDAVSYTWADDTGDASPRHFVYLGPQWYALPVTTSCFNVLKRLRTMATLVWIDSVCIDQASNTDRTEQVSMMSSIYRKAGRVVALIRPFESPTQNSAEPSTIQGLDEKTAQRLIQERYFRRVWVIQELLLGRDVLMIYERHEFSFEVLKGFISSWDVEAPDLPCPLRALPPCNGPENLLDLLVASRLSKASDNRDKVYALLGIVSSLSGRTIPIKPDYKRTTASLFGEVAALIVSYRGTEILEHTDCVLQQVSCGFCEYQGYARCCSCEQKDCSCCKTIIDHTHTGCCYQCFTHSLPSWVPNWTIDPLTAKQPALALKVETNPFFARAHSQPLDDFWVPSSKRMRPYIDLEGNFHGEGMLLDVVITTKGKFIYFQHGGMLESSKVGLLHRGDTLWLFPNVSTPILVSSRTFWSVTVRASDEKPPRRRLHVSVGVEGTFLGKCNILAGTGSETDSTTVLSNQDLLSSYTAYARRGLVKLDGQSSFWILK